MMSLTSTFVAIIVAKSANAAGKKILRREKDQLISLEDFRFRTDILYSEKTGIFSAAKCHDLV